MELLILSKLKWDLAAITAYDYLDHLLDAVANPEQERDDDDDDHVTSLPVTPSLPLDPNRFGALREQTERLITLCATDPAFLALPPSAVASASLASVVQKELVMAQEEEGDRRGGEEVVNLQEVQNRLQAYTNIEMVSSLIQNLIALLCRAFC